MLHRKILLVMLMVLVVACTPQSEEAVPIEIDATLDTSEFYSAMDVIIANYWNSDIDDEQVLAELDEFLALNPNHVTALAYRGSVHRILGNIERAMEDFDTALQLESESGLVYSMRGRLWLQEGDNQRALADLQRGIELAPNEAVAHYNLARGYFVLEMYDDALRRLLRAIDIGLNPYADSTFHENAAMVYIDQRNFSAAIEQANAALASNPDNPYGYLRLASAYRYLGQYDIALENANRALDLGAESNAFLWALRGEILIRSGDNIGAVEAYSRAVELDPTDAESYYNRGIALRRLGRYDESIASYTQGIQLNPSASHYYLNRGEAYRDAGMFDEAIADYTYAIELVPSFALAYSNRSVAHSKMGNYDLAVDDLMVAISIQPNVPTYWFNLSIEYINLEQYEASLEASARALQLRPNHAATHYNRAVAYSWLEDYENYERELARACELGYAPDECN